MPVQHLRTPEHVLPPSDHLDAILQFPDRMRVGHRAFYATVNILVFRSVLREGPVCARNPSTDRSRPGWRRPGRSSLCALLILPAYKFTLALGLKPPWIGDCLFMMAPRQYLLFCRVGMR